MRSELDIKKGYDHKASYPYSSEFYSYFTPIPETDGHQNLDEN